MNNFINVDIESFLPIFLNFTFKVYHWLPQFSNDWEMLSKKGSTLLEIWNHRFYFSDNLIRWLGHKSLLNLHRAFWKSCTHIIRIFLISRSNIWAWLNFWRYLLFQSWCLSFKCNVCHWFSSSRFLLSHFLNLPQHYSVI